MKYFTRGWKNGELSDLEAENAIRTYQSRIESLRERLAPDLWSLAREVDLHDAIIETIRWRPAAKELILRFATYDVSSNTHKTVTVTYRNALLGQSRIDTLRLAANSRETEVLCSEVDLSDDDLPIHRILFSPRDEVSIDCTSVLLEVSEREDLRVNLLPAFLEEEEED